MSHYITLLICKHRIYTVYTYIVDTLISLHEVFLILVCIWNQSHFYLQMVLKNLDLPWSARWTCPTPRWNWKMPFRRCLTCPWKAWMEKTSAEGWYGWKRVGGCFCRDFVFCAVDLFFRVDFLFPKVQFFSCSAAEDGFGLQSKQPKSSRTRFRWSPMLFIQFSSIFWFWNFGWFWGVWGFWS